MFVFLCFVVFYCWLLVEVGGEMLICDMWCVIVCVLVVLCEWFVECGVMYLCNFVVLGDCVDVNLNLLFVVYYWLWDDVFGMIECDEVEWLCVECGVGCCWFDDGSVIVLYVGSVLCMYLCIGEMVWFN